MVKKYKIALFLALIIAISACRSSKVVCPGAGQHSASDMSLFDEDGKPIVKKAKKKTSKKNDYGLINKSQPSNTKRYVKKSLNDRPKR